MQHTHSSHYHTQYIHIHKSVHPVISHEVLSVSFAYGSGGINPLSSPWVSVGRARALTPRQNLYWKCQYSELHNAGVDRIVYDRPTRTMAAGICLLNLITRERFGLIYKKKKVFVSSSLWLCLCVFFMFSFSSQMFYS